MSDMDSDMDLDLDLIPSPREPAMKRSKEMSPNFDETDVRIFNEMGWVIQTISTDIDKRKSSKTSYKQLEDCLPKLNNIHKQLKRIIKIQNTKVNMFKEMTTEFANGLAKTFAEKDSEINILKSTIAELNKVTTTSTIPTTYAQSLKNSRSRSTNRDRSSQNVVNRLAEISKSRAAKNRVRAVVAKESTPPPP